MALYKTDANGKLVKVAGLGDTSKFALRDDIIPIALTSAIGGGLKIKNMDIDNGYTAGTQGFIQFENNWTIAWGIIPSVTTTAVNQNFTFGVFESTPIITVSVGARVLHSAGASTTGVWGRLGDTTSTYNMPWIVVGKLVES